MSNITNEYGPIIAFLPCRKGSERVPNKNMRPFGPYQNGLIEIKLSQLLSCSAIDLVVLSTNDEEILAFAEKMRVGTRLILHHRDNHLSSSLTSTDALVHHVNDLITPLASDGHILWTHVTSPFITASDYCEIIENYRQALIEGYDSLMTTTLQHAFLWGEDGPINYDRREEKWPRTQTLKPVHEVNSGAFLAPAIVYSKYEDRIGLRPRLYPLNRLVAIDIDWEEDFMIAEQLLLHKNANI